MSYSHMYHEAIYAGLSALSELCFDYGDPLNKLLFKAFHAQIFYFAKT